MRTVEKRKVEPVDNYTMDLDSGYTPVSIGRPESIIKYNDSYGMKYKANTSFKMGVSDKLKREK